MMRHGQVTVPSGEEGMVIVHGMDVFTSMEYTTEPMNEAKLAKWTAGEMLIQEALPDATSADREFLITGIVVSEHPDMYTELE